MEWILSLVIYQVPNKITMCPINTIKMDRKKKIKIYSKIKKFFLMKNQIFISKTYCKKYI